MYPRWRSLHEDDQSTYHALFAFLEGRLMERETIAWALKSGPHASVKRLVIRDLIEDPYRDIKGPAEPWRSAWELMVESWSAAERVELDDLNAIGIQQRVRKREHSASLADAIVSTSRQGLRSVSAARMANVED